MEVWLLNAAHMKAVPGRKTDVRDAEWIAQLLEHGLLRPSFVPPPAIRRLRMLTRYRVQLMGDRTRETVRLELMLEDASIKLSTVASSLTTVSARAMLAAMIDGEPDAAGAGGDGQGPDAVEDPGPGPGAGGSLRRPPRAAGQVDPGPARTWSSRRWPSSTRSIEAACAPWAHQIELLQTIPGVGPKVAQVIIAETGGDMSQFPTAAHLASWAGVAPAIYESAGKRTPAGRRRGNKWLTAMLVEAAGSVGRMHGKNYLAVQHARLDPAPRDRAGRRSRSRTRSWSRLLHAQPRRALPRPRCGLAGPTQRRGPHPPARRPARAARPHRRPRPRRLTHCTTNCSVGLRPTALTRAPGYR